MAMMEHEDISNENLAGHLLVAAPYLDGAGFHHSVIFLSRAEKEFVIGHILNHPSGMNVGDVARHTEIPESLYAVPIFKGGPVERNQLIFAAFIRTEDKLRVQFHLQEEQALEYLEDPRAILRAYVGHSGWTPPQLRRELNDRAWYVSPMVPGHLPGNGFFQGLGHGHAAALSPAPYHEPRVRTAIPELNHPS